MVLLGLAAKKMIRPPNANQEKAADAIGNVHEGFGDQSGVDRDIDPLLPRENWLPLISVNDILQDPKYLNVKRGKKKNSVA